MNSEKPGETFIEKVSAFIVDKRKAFYLIFIIAVVCCVISIPKTLVNSDFSTVTAAIVLGIILLLFLALLILRRKSAPREKNPKGAENI